MAFPRLPALLAMLMASLAVPRAAAAKSVSIGWKAMRGAVAYEIQVVQDGKAAVEKRLAEPGWSGSLGPGIYSYRIRGIDRLKRPGKWTAPLPLVVIPKPTENEAPGDGKRVTLYDPSGGIPLKWKPVPGAARYRVQVSRGNALVRDVRVAEPAAVMAALPPGDYSWHVTAIFEARGRAPASIQGKQWPGPPGERSEFKVEHRKLEIPRPTFPLGTMAPPSNGRIQFKWKGVDGAEGYELEIRPSAVRARQPSSVVSKVIVTDTTATVGVPREGAYAWRVRALANVKRPDDVAASGPQSTAEFRLDRNASYLEGSGYVALSTLLAPYTYRIVSPSTGASGSAGSSSVTLRGSGEYWFRPQWGMGAAFESTSFQIGDQGNSRIGFELVGKYRVSFGDPGRGWAFAPKLGLEERDYFEIFPSIRKLETIRSSAYGAVVGFDLRKQISEKLSLGLKVAWFRPFLLRSSQEIALNSIASNRNASVGAQALYWVAPRWAVGAGAYLEKRSISYDRLPATAPAKAPEEIYMDGTYFFGSLLYRFGD